jgi:hypothetical protein
MTNEPFIKISVSYPSGAVGSSVRYYNIYLKPASNEEIISQKMNEISFLLEKISYGNLTLGRVHQAMSKLFSIDLALVGTVMGIQE